LRETGKKEVNFSRPYGTVQDIVCSLFPDMNIGAIFGCLCEKNSFDLGENIP